VPQNNPKRDIARKLCVNAEWFLVGELDSAVIGTCLAASEPKFWEELLPRLQKRAPIVIEALSAVDLHWMSVMTGTSIEEIVARIVGAGLDVVGGVGGEMLVERVMSDGPVEVVSVADWLGCMRWVHRVGGSSRALMRVSRHDSWEDRLLHLQKLRSLHDEVPGFRSFSIVSDPSEAEHLEPEVRVRCAALSRIFLDNVPALEELDVQKGELTSNILSIGAGIRDVSIIDADSARSKMLAHDLERIGVFLAPDAPHLLARS
jgi:2-iminoacetate synthase ThiH